MDAAAVILAGGESRRMGADKALLRFGGRGGSAGDGPTMLDATAEMLDALRRAGVIRRIVLACGRAPRYADIAERWGMRSVLDEVVSGPGEGGQAGPLAGLLAGLSAAFPGIRFGEWGDPDDGGGIGRDSARGGGNLSGDDDGTGRPGRAAFVMACDMPGMTAGFVQGMLRRFAEAGADALVPRTEAGWEPTAAVYGPRCVAAIRATLAAGGRRMIAFLPRVRTAVVGGADLRELDPAGRCLKNCNTPAELDDASRHREQGVGIGE